MSSSGVLVFDGSADVVEVDGESGRALEIVAAPDDVLVFDAAPGERQLEDVADPSTDFLVFDAEPTVTETTEAATSDFLLVDPPQAETRVVLDGDQAEDLLVVTPGGPPGPPGPMGPIGSEPDAPDFTLIFENGLY